MAGKGDIIQVAGRSDKETPGFDNPWLALPFLGIYAFPWLFVRPSLAAIVTAAIVLPVFMALFIIGNRHPARYGLVCALGMAVLGAAAAPLTLTAAALFVFAAALIGRSSAGRVTLYRLAALTAGVAVYGVWLHALLWQWLPVVFLCAIIGYYCHAGVSLHGQNRRLVASRREAERQAAQAERERMTRDLHDLLGRNLTLISVKAELAERLLTADPSRAGGELADIRSSAREALHEMRQVVSGTGQVSLAGEIDRARAMLATLAIPLEASEVPPDLPLSVDRGLAYVLREAVTNIARHAGPCRVRIAIGQETDRVRLTIRDSGLGGGGPDGRGVSGMRARIETLGGVFTLAYGKGAQVEAVVPLAGRPS